MKAPDTVMASSNNDPKDPTSLSLDPSTWVKDRPADKRKDQAEAPPAPSATSYDPSTWTKASQPPPPKPPAPSRPKASRRLLLIGAGAAVAASGAVAAVMLTGRKAPPASTGALAEGAERQVLTLSNLSGLAQALTAYGLAADAEAISAAAASQLPADAATGELRLELDLARQRSKAALVSLTLSRPDGSGVQVRPDGARFAATPLAAAVTAEVKVVRGQMDAESFYSSAVSAGLSDVLIPDFFQAFVYDFDFQREIEPGDVFEAAFEQNVNARGEPVGAKRLIYASMTTRAKARALYSFEQPGKGRSWFDGAGKNIRRTLMRTPVEGARISSGFGNRIHPIQGYQKMHKGVDFAAPTGTPIYASGDGAVEWAAMKGPNGNLVILQHDNGWRTYYLHLDSFEPGLAAGQRVRQGQSIGKVGTTGNSTGPHLHYEVHVENEAVDPTTLTVEAGETLSGATLAAFNQVRDAIDAKRAAAL